MQKRTFDNVTSYHSNSLWFYGTSIRLIARIAPHLLYHLTYLLHSSKSRHFGSFISVHIVCENLGLSIPFRTTARELLINLHHI